jgi:hypothetical protein
MKHKHKKLFMYTSCTLAVVAIAAAVGGVIFMKHHAADAAVLPGTPSNLPQKTPGTAEFSFKSNGKTSGWWQGATDKVSMALFYRPNDCFVSTEYHNSTIDAAAKLQSHIDMLRQGSSVTEIGSKSLTLNTSTGKMQYELHQYHVVGDGLLGGEEFAYVPLSKGYLKIQGYCDTPEQLAATIPALEAVKFTPSS